MPTLSGERVRVKYRQGVCAYCGRFGSLTREHVFPRWIGEAYPDSSAVTPWRERHPFGGASVVWDVCNSCNNGPLSRLDRHARRWWRGELGLAGSTEPHHLVALARWATKVVFNSHRLIRQEGTPGAEPAMPEAVRPWILGEAQTCPAVAVCACEIPPEQPLPGHAQLFGANGSPLPMKYFHVGSTVFFVVWDHPGIEESTAVLLANRLVLDRPSLQIDRLSGSEPQVLPVMQDLRMLANWPAAYPETASKIAGRLGLVESPSPSVGSAGGPERADGR